jgi:hypothetical protein
MAIREVDPIGAAITATEKEIAGAAWDIEDTTLDETGDRTVETMGDGLEGQHEPDEYDAASEDDESEVEAESEEGEGDEGEAKPEVKEPEGEEKPAVKAEGEREGRVPSGRLREANERAKALETQLETERTKSAEQVAALNARLDQLMVSLRQPPKPAEGQAEAKPVVPDFFEDPAGFLAAQTKPLTDTVGQLRSELAAQRVETSMAIAHSKHGESFAKAFEAVGKLNPQNPDDRAVVQRIYANPNPGEALVAWHKRNETLREVGDDPTKYREKIAAETREALMKDPEFRKSLIEGLREEASRGEDGKPNTTVRLPRSLNGAAGGNRRDATQVQYDDNDQAIAEAAWR